MLGFIVEVGIKLIGEFYYPPHQRDSAWEFFSSVVEKTILLDFTSSITKSKPDGIPSKCKYEFKSRVIKLNIRQLSVGWCI